MSDSSARDRYLQALMGHVMEDQYPSVTQMRHIESMLTREQREAWVNVLIDKIADDRYPSVEMMKRVEQLLEQLD